jgi:Zn-finger nucleic acid-binding protein
MPKTNIDWNKLIIYKIYCKDKTITDVYVGRTTDFIRRKSQHYTLSKKKQEYLYKKINENGGWDNWVMEIVENYPCCNSIEADDRENYWINILEATLNVKIKFCNIEYKKEWYFKNRESIRQRQKEYREKKQYEKKQYKELFSIDYHNENNNPEWYLNNIKNRIVGVK